MRLHATVNNSVKSFDKALNCLLKQAIEIIKHKIISDKNTMEQVKNVAEKSINVLL